MMTSSELAERMLNALDELVAADTPLDVILDALIRFAGEASVRAVYRAHPELAT